MNRDTIHRVDGVGRQIKNNDSSFDPRSYEQAIHGLQRIVLDIVRFDDEQYKDDYDPDHERATEDDQSVIHIQSDTALEKIISIIPRNWDVSIVTDLLEDREHNYVIRASVDCGEGYIVYANIYLDHGFLWRLDVGHTDITDPDSEITLSDFSVRSSSREIAHLNRYLERTVDQAYATTIDSAATAFDFISTKEDIPPGGPRAPKSRRNRENVSQKEWATVRDKTQQTVSDNVRSARKQLHDLPDNTAFDTTNPALEELDPDADDKGDIRLV